MKYSMTLRLRPLKMDTTLKHVILLFSIRNRPYFKHGKHSLLVWVRSDRAGYETTQLAGYETTGNHSFYYLLFYMRCNFTFNLWLNFHSKYTQRPLSFQAGSLSRALAEILVNGIDNAL